jgi:hypothetical protein
VKALTIWKQRLLTCPPFRGLSGPEVWDVEPGGARPPCRHACPERRALLLNLAGIMLFRESAADPTYTVNFDRGYQADMVATLDHWRAVYADLPPRGILLDGNASRHRSVLKQMRRLRDALHEGRLVLFAGAGLSLPAAPLHLDARAMTLKTVQLMATDFRAFGPKTFSQAAICRAVAAILETLDIHSLQGKPFTAEGVKKVLARHPPTLAVYGRDN